MIEARLVSSTSRRTVVRRSTSGAATRSSIRPHRSSTTTAAANRPSVVGDDQPQSLPLLIGRRKRIRPADRPSAPGRSKEPLARSGDSGTTSRVRAMERAPRPAAPK